MNMVLHDSLWRYRQRLNAGEVDTDLSAQEHGEVSYLLACAIGILSVSGSTDRETLTRMSIDRQRYSARVCDRVALIIKTA
jgi:hypothetical protein